MLSVPSFTPRRSPSLRHALAEVAQFYAMLGEQQRMARMFSLACQARSSAVSFQCAWNCETQATLLPNA